MQRFQNYMDDTLDTAASKAEQAVVDTLAELHELVCLRATDFADRLEQVRKRDAGLADLLTSFQAAAVKRRDQAIAILNGEAQGSTLAIVVPVDEVQAFAVKLKAERDGLAQAGNAEERAKLTTEKAELEDRKTLSANRAKLVTRRDLLIVDDAYGKA